MSRSTMAEEEIILIESGDEEDSTSSKTDGNDSESAYSTEEEEDEKRKYGSTITSRKSSVPIETSPIVHDTSQFEKELKSKRNNFLSKYINRESPNQQFAKNISKANNSSTLETKTSRDSIHLTQFKIDEVDIIDFGKPLTSNTTSANINIQSKNCIESEDELENEMRRNAITSREDDLIQLEDIYHDVNNLMHHPNDDKQMERVDSNEPALTEDPSKSEIKKELSFYQKWFGFYKNDEEPETKTETEETPRASIDVNKTLEQYPVYKIAILGEDLSDSLIAAEFIQEEFKKTISNPDESIMKKQFNFGGKPYQLELFFYDMYEQFVNMMDQCLKECDGFLIVYNVASRRSFQQVDILYEKLYRAKDGGTISMVLVGIEYLNKIDTGSPPSTTTLLQQHSTNTPITPQSSTSTSGQLGQDHIDLSNSRKASTVSISSATKYWNNNSTPSGKHHSFRSNSFVTSQHGKERQVSKREGLKKSLFYYVPFIEMNSDEPKSLIQQKVKEIFQNLLREIVQGGNLRYSAVKPLAMTNAQYLTNQLGSSWHGSEKSDHHEVIESYIPPNQDSYNIVMNSVRALFTNLNVHGYCLNTPINDEKELEQIEFLVDHFESYQVTCPVIEICLKRFDFRNVKLKLKQKVTPHNEQQILSFLFDIPLKKKNILQMMFTKSDENYQKEINERLVFAIFIATFAKQLYSEQNQQLFDGTFMVSLEDEWNFILNLKNLFETVKKKVKEYTSLEELVEDQVIRMVDWMEKNIHLKRGNEIEMLMKFLLQHVTSPIDCYGFERRIRPHVLGNRYLILKRIFSNHHSKIYKSVKVKSSSLCALKHLTNFTKSDLTEVGKGVESMIIFPKHPNVMTFSDYTIRRCRSDRFEIFIELSYMNGANMEKRLEFMIKNNRFFNYLELVDIYLQTTRGLAHLHQNSIVFPSLKLEKILLCYNEQKESTNNLNSSNVNTPSGSEFKSSMGRYDLLENVSNINSIEPKLSDLKSVIIKAFDENDSLLGDQHKSNLNVKLTDWFKPWDFSILDGTVQFKNRQVMEQFHNKNNSNEWTTVRSTTTPTISSASHSTLRKQIVLHEIMSSNTHDRINFDGDIERYLDEKDDIFRLGCIFYQLVTKESFIRLSNLQQNLESFDNSNASSPTSTTTTVILKKSGNVEHNEMMSNVPFSSSKTIGANNHLESTTTAHTNQNAFEYVSIEEAISRDEKLTHHIMASKIHMSLLKSEAIPHLSSPQLHPLTSNNSSVQGLKSSGSETSSPMSITSPPSSERINPSSSTSFNPPTSNILSGNDTPNVEKLKKTLYYCSPQNEQLLIGLIHQMTSLNPNQRPTLKKIFLILEVLMKYNQIDQDICETLLNK